MHILIAPNAFKNSLTATQATLAIRKGLTDSKLNFTFEEFPIGDGGDGTGHLIVEKCKGKKINMLVRDAIGRKINTTFGLIDDGKTAVIEMADASGIGLLKADELNPLQANSFGTGEQIKIALDCGVQKIIIAMGGSATVDGGTGILTALGIQFLNEKGDVLSGLPGSLIDLSFVDLSGLDKRILQTEIIVLCDVDNVLLGEKGAAAMFGPQKGANPEAVNLLEAGLKKLAEVCLKQTKKEMATIPFGGTAGGAAAGLWAFLDAKLVNGIDYFLHSTGFDKSLKNANLVITGEGSIDEQTLQGKGPFGVAKLAKIAGVPVVGLAGRIPLIPLPKMLEYFDVLLAIGHQPTDLSSAMANTMKNLFRTSTALGNLLAITSSIKKS